MYAFVFIAFISVYISWTQQYHMPFLKDHSFIVAYMRDLTVDNIDDFKIFVSMDVFIVAAC